MRIGIDASNLRRGGGITHLVELLSVAKPEQHGIDKIIVWGNAKTLMQLPSRPWLEIAYQPLLDKSLLFRLFWQQQILPKLARKSCDLLFAPGGMSTTKHRPFVTMFRNMLPFDETTNRPVWKHWLNWRWRLLRYSQVYCFRRADGMIYLNDYGRIALMRYLNQGDTFSTIIPHGVSSRFRMIPRQSRDLTVYSDSSPFRLLYVSIVYEYKNHCQVVEAVGRLRREGLPVSLDLIGGVGEPSSLKRLKKMIAIEDPEGRWCNYKGQVPFGELHNSYHEADAFIYASSCENLPNILIEAMSAGLPIACSNISPMPEVLGNAGIYFNPNKTDSIASSLKTLIIDSKQRETLSWSAYNRSLQYTWEECSDRTFAFLAHVMECNKPHLGESLSQSGLDVKMDEGKLMREQLSNLSDNSTNGHVSQPFVFKLKKALRYVRMYGLARTMAKVKGQYHMNKTYKNLPLVPERSSSGRHVAIMGCGNFAYSCIAYYVRKNYGNVLRGAMDHNINRAASLFEHYGLDFYSDNPERIYSDSNIDLVFIASNHASHAEYAIKALEVGKSVHIEKPHVVSEDQLLRLCRTMEKSSGKVALGFNRPYSWIGQQIKAALDSQSGASIFNWFIAGHEIPADHWYFKEEEGGRVLGNLCHWTDFVYQMVPEENRYPLTIRPTRSAKSDCDIAVTYTFGDGTIAAITFSAKGHTFEGVKERFAAHRGNVLITMDDFKDLTIENVDHKKKHSLFFRDHGHEASICSSYEMVKGKGRSCTTKYVWETGQLFLQTREALEKNCEITLTSWEQSFISDRAVTAFAV